jgi:imidazole glycerol-phosphate synthase subunit HisF
MRDRQMFYGARKNVFRKAFLLRNRQTEAEEILWDKLSKSQLGYRFKRQHPVELFVADFYCHKAKLIIELDGSYHDKSDQIAYDMERTKVLECLGLRVMRFRDKEVFENIDSVVVQIKQVMHASIKG